VTYLGFHAVFILPPILLLWSLVRKRIKTIHPRAGLFLPLMAAIAFVYTTPWDNYLVATGVWGYGPDKVIGTIGYVPIEEYLFFLLQPLLTGLWLYVVHDVRTASASPAARWLGGAVYGAIAVAGLLLLRRPEGTYLGLILAWAAPVLALQWLYAGQSIWARRRLWTVAVAVPTLYLWIADAVAIHLGVWHISEAHTLGPALGPLPLEEAVFFLVTNLLVVQGLILFIHPPARVNGAGAGTTAPARSAVVG
jgi:lycopene beta-cyclase